MILRKVTKGEDEQTCKEKKIRRICGQ